MAASIARTWAATSKRASGTGSAAARSAISAEVPFGCVAEAPIGTEHGRYSVEADRIVAIHAERMIRQQAQGVTEILAVDLPDLELGQEQVRERDRRLGAIEPAAQIKAVAHRQFVDQDVHRPAAVRFGIVEPLSAVNGVEQLLGDVALVARGTL